jgi:hypothetical protein
MQLPLLRAPVRDGLISGCWSAGERLLRVGGALVPVNVWFHLFEGGEAVLSLRQKEECQALRVHGRWWLEGSELVMTFGGGQVRAPFILRDEILEWADETMLRLPDRMASLAFGVQLPYRRSRDGIAAASSTVSEPPVH